MNGVRGVSMLGDTGAMLLADSLNNRLRWFGQTQSAIQRTEVNFDPTNLAGTSQPQSVTVTSTGSGLLVMGSVDLGIDKDNFVLDPQNNTCGRARLEPGNSCFFQVAFQPRALGDHTGSVQIPNDALGGAQLVRLSGQATAALVGFSPPAVSIYQSPNGTPASTVVTLTNNGDGVLHIDSIALDKGAQSAFSQSNNCPSSMAAHSTCQITIGLNPIDPNDLTARTDTLVVRDDAAGNKIATHTVPVTGGVAQPSASFNRQSMVFTQNIGNSSPSQNFVLKNSGQVPLRLSGIRDDGDFAQTNNCPQVLPPGASCVISVTFIPSTLGERDGYIVVASDSQDSPQRIAVTGVATMALAQLGPARLNFSQNVGATSPQQTVMLTNHGDGPLSIAGIVATGDFKAYPHCPSVLLPGISCSIGVAFAPQAAGSRKGSLLVNDDASAAPGSEQSVLLTGTAYQPLATLSTGTLSPGANLGTSAAAQTVSVTNTGDGVLTVRSVSIAGAAAGDYRQSNNCVRAIQPGGSCSITVNFAPRAYGLRVATLTLLDDGPGGSQSVALRGQGTAPRPLLSASFLNFGGASVGSASAPQSIVLFNAGNGPLSINGINLTGDDFRMTTTCGPTLVAGASCRISVMFMPRVTGARSGLVTISDSAGSQRFTLSGVGT
jgi:archaellum component FlaF (FlaF/FlaG flagellin family)